MRYLTEYTAAIYGSVAALPSGSKGRPSRAAKTRSGSK
jgi:hypothetical protein